MDFNITENRLLGQTRLLHLMLSLLTILCIVDARPLCDHDRYGSPASSDCITALSQFPQDKAVRFFVEQQMRTKPPSAVWQAFQDSRLPQLQEPIIQLPKWMSYGQPNPDFTYLLIVILEETVPVLRSC